jgi:hypothetical protein
MPLKFLSQDNAPLCHGHDWTVVDEATLIKLLARLVTGYYAHVEAILRDPNVPLPVASVNSHAELRAKLGKPKSNETRYHRDGWIFQMISWVAAHLTASASVLIAPPQPRQADKGFDGLIVELRDKGKRVEGVVICEDKATEDGRSTISSKVWPELIDFERGARDAELQNEVTALLRGARTDVLNTVENIHWKEVRKYRVSVTVSEEEHALGGRPRLFKGFDKKVRGDHTRRQGEYIVVKDVRAWMDKLCELLLAELDVMAKVKNV